MPQWEWALLGDCLAHCKAQDFWGLGKRVSDATTGGPIWGMNRHYQAKLDSLYERHVLIGRIALLCM